MWRWSKAAISRMCLLSNMPLPNTSPLMSPIPTTVKSWVWVSIPISRKCRFTASQAPGGDAHGLVVVAHRSARGERVAQPEPIGLGDIVGDIGKGGSTFVGGHYQVGVVAVTSHHLGRGLTLAVA